jgi:putative peptidoglycan lipid II flippase
MRSATVTFLSRGDTITPVKALFFAVAVNVALKILLMHDYAQVGLAFATAVGAWVNLLLLLWFAARAKLITIEARLRKSMARLAIAALLLAVALWVCHRPVVAAFAGWPLAQEATLAALGLIGLVVYSAAVFAPLGWRLMIVKP